MRAMEERQKRATRSRHDRRSGPEHVTRMDYARNHGWWVRVYRGGRCHSKFFSDSRHGGKRRGLSAAVEYRDELLRRLPQPRRDGRGEVAAGHHVEKFGVRWIDGRDGWLYRVRVYEAWIKMGDGRVPKTTWSVDKHGEEVAVRRVREWLREKKRELRMVEKGE